ncbi:protein of unknown function DUF34 [Alkaliphilus metalliredigens QYMF]|uniref:GTP cyclohydrolase 1 type 2 homolog n=1 Tax=Alkaliphilus metalliredigens (strain QYMF) TaxID=293826 RepID=A6TSG6_ALKMQ|nr:Nif3-like dinuclear metal center hexameric protein [Alkaliphilus metalliredigens]ABR49134.1 protein of unknown function DUF34 [Alkaliphilus metalliredigens QYMF]
MSQKVKEIVGLVEGLAPQHYAMKWDHVGLQVGDPEAVVNKVLVCLDLTQAVLKEAIEKEVQLIITHHPFLFTPLKKVIKTDIKGSMVFKAIQNGISIYSVHTNIDVARDGLNDSIAKRIGLQEITILQETYYEKLLKLVVFVPKTHEEQLAQAIGIAGAGHIGNYSHCSFRTEGMGAFMPLEGTNPYIGQQDVLERVEEVRLETILRGSQLKTVLKNMMVAHPYEEVAYDLYPLENKGEAVGLGRMGRLEKPITLSEFIQKLKGLFEISSIRVVGNLRDSIERVCVLNGSGADFIDHAIRAGCDCMITGDVKYHDAQDALEQGFSVIDLGHFESEKHFGSLVATYLEERLAEAGSEVEVLTSTIDINPFQIL